MYRELLNSSPSALDRELINHPLQLTHLWVWYLWLNSDMRAVFFFFLTCGAVGFTQSNSTNLFYNKAVMINYLIAFCWETKRSKINDRGQRSALAEYTLANWMFCNDVCCYSAQTVCPTSYWFWCLKPSRHLFMFMFMCVCVCQHSCMWHTK